MRPFLMALLLMLGAERSLGMNIPKTSREQIGSKKEAKRAALNNEEPAYMAQFNAEFEKIIYDLMQRHGRNSSSGRLAFLLTMEPIIGILNNAIAFEANNVARKLARYSSNDASVYLFGYFDNNIFLNVEWYKLNPVSKRDADDAARRIDLDASSHRKGYAARQQAWDTAWKLIWYETCFELHKYGYSSRRKLVKKMFSKASEEEIIRTSSRIIELRAYNDFLPKMSQIVFFIWSSAIKGLHENWIQDHPCRTPRAWVLFNRNHTDGFTSEAIANLKPWLNNISKSIWNPFLIFYAGSMDKESILESLPHEIILGILFLAIE